MAAAASSECPFHPLDAGADGVIRPPRELNPLYGELREQGTGVPEIVRPDGRHAFLALRYEDLLEVYRRDDTFSRALAAGWDDVDVSGTILALDGEEHARVRGVVSDAFTLRSTTGRQRAIVRQAEAALAGLLAAGEGADLVTHFTLPYALEIVSDMLGVPTEDRGRFRGWGEGFLARGALSAQEAESARNEMGMYLGGLLAARAAAPEDDLLTQITTRGRDLDPMHQVMLALALIIGGWDTVASALATQVEILTTTRYGDHERAWDHLRAHPEQIPGAVEELLRLYSTSSADDMPRVVTTRTVLPSGAVLEPDQAVFPGHDGGNRDPRRFTDPEVMRFDRGGPQHLSFGNGRHYCLGRHLAVAELEIALRLLTERLPRLRLAVAVDQVERKAGQAVRGPVRLPVRWS